MLAAGAGFEVGVETMPLEAFWRALIHRRASDTVGALSSIGLPLSVQQNRKNNGE